MSTSFSTYDNVDILQVFFVMRDLISHVKRLTRRSCKFSDRHALKREGVLLMLRLEKIFGPLEAGAIVFHLAMIHGPEDLRWGFSQGVWCFENFWGYLGRFKTRQVNPEANIMKMHHSAQFVNAAREGSQLSEILRNHNSLEVRNLKKLVFHVWKVQGAFFYRVVYFHVVACHPDAPIWFADYMRSTCVRAASRVIFRCDQFYQSFFE